MRRGLSVLLIDNYDSFVYNLAQDLGELGVAVRVVRNDKVGAHDVGPEDLGVVISPGPGHPRDAGRCAQVIAHCAATRRPLLGVCLGHQAIGHHFGAAIAPAPSLVHGRASAVTHRGVGVFAGLPSPFAAGRYHSLVVDQLPDELEATAWADGVLMGLRHRELPIEGVQFHPESVLTQGGYLLLANWLAICGLDVRERAATLQESFDQVRARLPDPVAQRTGPTGSRVSLTAVPERSTR